LSEDIDNNLNTNNSIEEKITVKKSTYNNLLKGIVAAIAIATFFGGYAIGTIDTNSNSSVTAEELKEIISEIEIKTATQPSQVPTQQPTPPRATQIYDISIDDDPVKGDPNAPVTIIEFSDFQCPFCSRFYSQTLPLIEKNYIDTGKIKLVYKDLPLDNLHSNARTAHIAAECADEQGKFWEYHDILFEKQLQWQSLSPSNLDVTLTNFAVGLEMQNTAFQACMGSQEIADEVNDDTIEAASYGTTGTPTFFIGNEKDGFVKLVGAQPFSAFKLLIDSRLES